MKIIKAYQTSKGAFLTLEEASKKGNRVREYDSRDGGCVGRENPKEIYLLHDNGVYFYLTPVMVKED